MLRISDVEWKRLPADYKSVIKGQKFKLGLVEGGATGLIPVEVVKGKVVDALVEKAFYKVGSGVQINIMNLGKISRAGVQAYMAGGDIDAVEQAVAEAVQQYAEVEQ